MAITAGLVKELREKTGAGMMDCKNALVETNGDIEAAVDYLREKGIAKAAKKSGKVAAEGAILIEENDTLAIMSELNSQTDFVAISDPFKQLHKKVSSAVFAANATTLEEAKNASCDSTTVEDTLVEAVASIGENIQLRRIATYTKTSEEVFGTYVHANSKVGVIVKVKGTDAEFAKGVAMHIAAIAPTFVSEINVPSEVVAKEREIAQAETLETAGNKPQNIIEKIVDGKVAKYLKEICLVDQKYVIDDSKTVAQAAKEVNCEIIDFVRFEVGEGIEKEIKDFAAEVASQMG